MLPAVRCALFVGLLLSQCCLATAPLLVYSEPFYPYAYPSAEGEPTGISVELTQAFLEDSGTPVDFQFIPFQRAVLTVDTKPNIMIANIVRSGERENKFQWLTALFCSQTWLYGLASSPTPTSLTQLPALAREHRIGSVRDSSSYHRLRELGVAEHNIEVVDSFVQNWGKLRRGRVDYITGLTHVEHLTAHDEEPVVTKIALSGPMPFYLATGVLSDKTFSQRWQQQNERADIHQKLKRIREKYGMPECPTPIFGR